MDIMRRHFVKGCAAASVALPAFPAFAASPTAVVGKTAPDIEKSIKASFGGGFSLKAHAQAGGQTYANIEHDGNWYAVASENLLDWTIVQSSLG